MKGPNRDVLQEQILITSFKMRTIHRCLLKIKEDFVREYLDLLRSMPSLTGKKTLPRLPDDIIAHIFSLLCTIRMPGGSERDVSQCLEAIKSNRNLRRLVPASIMRHVDNDSFRFRETSASDGCSRPLAELLDYTNVSMVLRPRSEPFLPAALESSPRLRSLTLAMDDPNEAARCLEKCIPVLPQLRHFECMPSSRHCHVADSSEWNDAKLPDLKQVGRSPKLLSAKLPLSYLSEFASSGLFAAIRRLSLYLSDDSPFIYHLRPILPNLPNLASLTLECSGSYRPTNTEAYCDKPLEAPSLKTLRISTSLYSLGQVALKAFASCDLDEFSISAWDCPASNARAFFVSLHDCFPRLSRLGCDMNLESLVRVLSRPSKCHDGWLLPALHALRLFKEVNPVPLTSMLRARASASAQGAAVVPINFLRVRIPLFSDAPLNPRLGEDVVTLHEIGKWVPNVVRVTSYEDY